MTHKSAFPDDRPHVEPPSVEPPKSPVEEHRPTLVEPPKVEPPTTPGEIRRSAPLSVEEKVALNAAPTEDMLERRKKSRRLGQHTVSHGHGFVEAFRDGKWVVYQ